MEARGIFSSSPFLCVCKHSFLGIQNTCITEVNSFEVVWVYFKGKQLFQFQFCLTAN